jgi:hypothetical protein
MRREGYRQVGDVIDVIKEDVDTANHILGQHQPTGQPETTTAPEIGPAPHDAPTVGDFATGVFVLGMLFGEAGRWLYGKLDRERGA